MTQEEIDAKKKAEQEALVKEIKADIKGIVATQLKESTDESGKEIAEFKQNFKSVNEKLEKLQGDEKALTEIKESIDAINKAQKEQGEMLGDLKLKEGEKTQDPSNDEFGTAIKTALSNAGFLIEKDEKGNEILEAGGSKEMVFGASGKAKPEFKAAHIITSADVTGLAIPTDFSVMGKDQIPVNTNDHMVDFYTTRPTSKATQMSLIVEYDFEGDPAIRAEGVDAPLVSMKLKSKEFKIFTTAAKATISWEENDDVPELIARIKEIVPDKIKQVMDADLITTGGDNSAKPWGCLNTENATPFNALEYAGLGEAQGDEVDLAMWMSDQCETADYSANGIFMGQKMQKKIASKRSTTDDAIIDTRMTRSKGVVTNLYNMAVKKSRLFEGKFLVSVTNMNRIGIRKNISVVAGFNADDLSKMQITFVFYIRYGYGSQNVNSNVWTDDIDGDLAIINEVAATSLASINGYAVGSDATPMTIQQMTNAGGTSLVPANLEAYKVAVAAETGIANAAALQVVIDAVNAA